MTLSYWNKQFQMSKLLPDFQDCLVRMAERSSAVDWEFTTIAYGDHPRQMVEVAGTPGPILPVFIHGGYWRALTAEMHRFVLPSLAGSHGCVANLEYRLMPEVRLGAIVQDAIQGLRLLAERTERPLFVVGHSAGGHLAVMGALHLPEHVVGAVGVSGLYELDPLAWSFLRDEVGLMAEDLHGLSPQALWQGRDARHVMVAVGADETPEFRRQAEVFASAHGARIRSIPGAHHMTVLDALADSSNPFASDVQDMLHSCVRRGPHS